MIINTSGFQSNEILFKNMNDNSQNIKTMLDNINRTFNLSPSYFQITKIINGIEDNKLYDTWLMDQEAYKEDIGIKKIMMKPDQDLNKGEIIMIPKWGNQKWLVVTIDPQTLYYNTGLIEFCNNTLNWYDTDANGKIVLIQEPCIVDYGILKDKSIRDRITFDDISLLNNEKYVIVQNNQFTKKIANNQRFVIDKQAYKVESINTSSRENIDDKDSIALLKIHLYKDQIAENDDLENNIANGLNITPTTSNIVIDPIINKICINDTQTFSVYKNVNGTNQGDTFAITASEVPAEYYTLNIIDGNHFSITNNEQYFDNDLVITCTNNVDNSTQTFNVTLGGAW